MRSLIQLEDDLWVDPERIVSLRKYIGERPMVGLKLTDGESWNIYKPIEEILLKLSKVIKLVVPVEDDGANLEADSQPPPPNPSRTSI